LRDRGACLRRSMDDKGLRLRAALSTGLRAKAKQDSAG